MPSLPFIKEEIQMQKCSLITVRINRPVSKPASDEISLGMESFIDASPELSHRRRIITCWKESKLPYEPR
jgi:hypothetical protein